MKGHLIVFVGAGLGGMARHAVNVTAMKLGATFPWHTLLVNVVGSLLMGLLIGWLTFKGNAPQEWRLFAATGVLGGYTATMPDTSANMLANVLYVQLDQPDAVLRQHNAPPLIISQPLFAARAG